MWLKKIKQKKLQFLLISIILIVTSMIFTVSLNFTNTVTNYSKEYYEKENIKDLIVQTYDENSVEKIKGYIENNENDKDVKEIKAFIVDRLAFKDNKNLDLGMASIVVYSGEEKNPWDLIITSGEKNKVPSKGTIWVQSIIADLKDIKVNDTIDFKVGDTLKSFKVEALVNDSVLPSSMISTSNFYINEDDLDMVNGLTPYTIIGYNTKETPKMGAKALAKTIGDDLKGVIFDKETYIMAANSTSSIVSGVGIITGILIFALSIVIIRFFLWSSILKEYKSIGVYKSLGFTSRKIRGIYLKTFGIVSIIAITIGSLISIFFSDYLVKLSVKYIGNYTGSSNNLIFVIIAIVVLSLILIVNLSILLRRINKIKPVEAFRVGITSSKEKFTKSVFKNTTSPLAMAINDMFKYKKQSLIILSVLTSIMYISIFFLSMRYSTINLKTNAANVFGVVQGDLTLDFPSGDTSYKEALNELNEDSRIKGIVETALDMGVVVNLNVDKYNLKSNLVTTLINDSYVEENDFKVSILEGRNPKNSNEISVSEAILKDSGLKVGDYIDVTVGSVEKTLLITGSYSSMMSEGYSIRVLDKLISEEERLKLNNININVTLEDKNKIEEVKDYYKNKYDVCSIDVSMSLIDQSSKSVATIVKPVTTVIIIGVIIFAILNLVNLLIMNNIDNRRKNAILKSLGFTTNYIIKRSVYRIAILVVLAAMVAYGLNNTVSAYLFKFAINTINGLMIPINQVVAMIVGIVVVTISMAIISMLSIKRISTIELMEE